MITNDSAYSFIYQWDHSKFMDVLAVPKGYWDVLSNQRSFLDNLAKKLNISSPEGWYYLTCTTFRKHNGTGLLSKYDNSPRKLLQAVYPEYPRPSRFLDERK